MDQVDSMSDAEVRAGLLKHGYNVPVTASNRNMLKNKLRSLLAKNTDRPLRYTVVIDEPAVQPVHVQPIIKIVAKNTIDFKTSYQIYLMSDEELHARLLEHGYNVRVTESNRSILRKKLEDLLTNNNRFGYTARKMEPVATVKPAKPQVPLRNSTDFFTASEVPSLTNAELRAKLKQYGYRNMPVTETTRSVLERKLMALLSNKPGPSKPVNRETQDMWHLTEPSSNSDSDVETNSTISGQNLPRNNLISSVNRETQDMWHLTEPSSNSDSDVEANSTISGLNLPPNNLISLQHGPTNVCDNPKRVTIPNIPSESIRNVDGSNTDSMESHGLLSVSTDISTTTSNNSGASLTSQPLEFLQPTKNILISSQNTNASGTSLFNNVSRDTTSVPQSSEQSIDQEMEYDTSDLTKSHFREHFMSRLLALTEEPPKALSYNERKRNCLTPLQQRVLHGTSKRIRTE